MSKLNKTAVAVLVALGSSAVAAGTMGPVGCVPENVVTPCESCGWNIEASALYLRPTYDADFGYHDVFAAPDGSLYYHDIDHRYRWGFEIGASTHWGSGKDFVVNWYHLSSGHHPDALSPISVFADDVEFTVPNGTFERSTTWNAVNFEFGQEVLPSCKWWRFSAGAQYAQIRTNDRRFFPTAVGVAAFEDFHDHDFNGFGPRGTWDARYMFGGDRDCGFGVSFHSAAAVLAGHSRFNNRSTLAAAFGPIPYSEGSKSALVPELEGKLALNWLSKMDCGNVVNVELGWMWFNYFNVHHNFNFGFGNETDFGATGPYLTFNMKTGGGNTGFFS